MNIRLQLRACLCLCACFALGCRLVSDEPVVQGRSPLKPARPSPDSVKMEIIWARFPAGDPALNHDAWREIDETQLPPSLQRELANNGLRAGVIGATLPDAIAQALDDGDAPSGTISETTVAPGEPRTIDLSTEPIIHGRVRRLRRDQRNEIQASELHASLPLLISDGRELRGKTYQQAQAVYALRVDPQPDRTVVIELTPELQHGAPRIRWTGGEDGILRQAPLRSREVFDRLRLTVRLAPGEMLVLMSLPDAGSRLGHYFHTVESAEGPKQKLILLRLAEVPPGDMFAAGHPH